jgi:hypothetical protein
LRLVRGLGRGRRLERARAHRRRRTPCSQNTDAICNELLFPARHGQNERLIALNRKKKPFCRPRSGRGQLGVYCFADRNGKAAQHRSKTLPCRRPHQTRQWLADGENRRIIALGMGPTKQSQPGGITTSSITSAAAPRKPPAPRSRRHRPPRGSRAASLDEDRLDLLFHRL